MADGRNGAGPPEDSSSCRVTAPNYPDARRKNMKCIAVVVIMPGMFMIAGTTIRARRTRARIYDMQRVSWAERREDLRRRKAFGRALPMS